MEDKICFKAQETHQAPGLKGPRSILAWPGELAQLALLYSMFCQNQPCPALMTLQRTRASQGILERARTTDSFPNILLILLGISLPTCQIYS